MLNDEKYKSFSAKEFLLYMLLLNRLNISKKNRRYFCDKKGFFVYYSYAQIKKDVRCSHPTVTTLLNNLEKAGLIHKEYQANGLPLKIYVNDIREGNVKAITPKYNPKPESKQKETSFDIDRAVEQSKLNKYNFGEMKNPRARHKKRSDI